MLKQRTVKQSFTDLNLFDTVGPSEPGNNYSLPEKLLQAIERDTVPFHNMWLYGLSKIDESHLFIQSEPRWFVKRYPRPFKSGVSYFIKRRKNRFKRRDQNVRKINESGNAC